MSCICLVHFDRNKENEVEVNEELMTAIMINPGTRNSVKGAPMVLWSFRTKLKIVRKSNEEMMGGKRDCEMVVYNLYNSLFTMYAKLVLLIFCDAKEHFF